MIRLKLTRFQIQASLLSGFLVLIFQYTNCGQPFRSTEFASDPSVTPAVMSFGMCKDESQRALHQIHVLGASEYENIAEDLFPGQDLGPLRAALNVLPVVPDVFDGNLVLKDHAGFITSREPIVEAFAANLDRTAAGLCDRSTKPCRNQVLGTTLARIFRRPVAASEIVALVDESMDLSFLDFSKLIFFSPEFHFKTHALAITSDQFVAKVAMALFGTFPDDGLVARKNEIFTDPGALKQELLRLLKDPRFARRFSRRFWRQWLSMQKLEFLEVPGNSGIDKNQLLDAFYSQIERAIVSGESLTGLFHSASATPMPASVLTHPAFAAASSRVIGGELKSHYVQRGVNIASGLLCIGMPSLPAATREELEQAKRDTSTLTHAQAIEVHRSNPRCASCHSIIDPIGVSMERVSPTGTYRTTFDDGSPIRIEGQFLGSNYTDLSSLIGVISQSEQLRLCFSRNLKGLLDGAEGRKVSACDAKEAFTAQPDLPIIDSLAKFLSSDRFREHKSTLEARQLQLMDEVITDLYRRGLGREPEEGAVNSWLRFFRSSGEVAVGQGILTSPEMTSFNLNDADYVKRSFAGLVGRDPTMEEQVYWQGRLTGIERAEFVKSLAQAQVVQARLAILKEGSQ